ncbi:periplasmic binding protein [Salinarchaeum sp. Harcht-Bsk1]|uniref:PGF-CTERM-anchored ABC transporter substrate-binding protein n=1 Tax=Salinarchaeum sp. Harcht-Bsk1 TaxID=1333523 RepID=UPI000342365F|nr:PGF-CTERM-anchored ABC transporter substrate-binding protein [Salinarchaeum sp. Harcht-Bsk1]AGN00769.1 periplasmic binding protein [Salinarchaeum sp. Harcht-Bsk1]
MTRTSKALVAALVVVAALVGGVGHVAAADAVGPTTAEAALAQENCSFPVTLTDASGTDVTLDESPEDVVVLGASSAQTVWELGEQDRVVGMPVGPSTAYLDGSQDRTHVLDGIRVQTETVVDLDPDVVIAPGGIIAPEDVQALRDAGLTVYVTNDGNSIQDVRDRVTSTGRLLGACDAADDTVSWMDERLAVVNETTQGVDRPSVFYWLGGGYTAGSGTFQGELLQLAGADNAAANMGISGWAAAEPEAIVAEDPDYILVSEGTTLPEDHPVQQTTAVQEGNVITVNGNYWNQPAPRIVLAVEEVTQQLHNESYQEATSDSEGSSGDALPGFGVGAAAIALLGTVLALQRRE